MPAKTVTKYNPYARETLDELFLVDEDFDQLESPLSPFSRLPTYMN